MSEVAEKKAVVAAPSEPLFSAKNRRLLTDPFDDNNPITVQVLGICSALAVTTQVYPALVMAISVTMVCAFSNFAIALMRNGIPPRIRMIVQLVVIATLVTIVDQLLKAFAYDVSKELSVFVGLIITNCIVMGRLEAFAMNSKPWPAFLDGIGNGLGYGAILIIVAVLREFFGAGSILGWKLIPEGVYAAGYADNGIMLTPAAAMFVIGILIWIQRSKNTKLVDIS
ncbi:MAG: NADH:ubiquinone reductase (Na(+)-transporting) subunit D [Chitinophagales bacterium]